MSKQRIGEATLILAVGTLAVNVIQVLKLLVVSAWFGASTGLLDQYFVALNLPLAFQGVIVGALQASFIPVYVGLIAEGKQERAQRMLSSTLAFGMIFFLVLCGGLALFARPLLAVVATGFSKAEQQLNVTLFRWFLIMLFTNGMTDLLTAFYNANKRYFLPALAPVGSILISLVWILAFPEQGVYALVFGMIAGGVFQLLVLLGGTLRYKDFRLGLSWNFLNREYVPIYSMMIPVGAGLLLGHTNLIVDQAVASTLPKGSVSILNYAGRLHDVVVKVFVMSVGGSLLPFLSHYFAERRYAEVRSTLSLSMRIGLMLLAPVAILVWFFGAPVISAVFQRNLFTAVDSAQVGLVWTAYSFGLFFTAATVFQGRALNANRDLHPLWIVTAIGIPVNIALDVYLARYFGVTGIAVGTSMVYLFYAMVFRWRLQVLYRTQAVPKPALSPIWKTLLAIMVTGLLAYVTHHVVGAALNLQHHLTAGDRLIKLAACAVASVATVSGYLLTLQFLRVNEVGTLLAFARRLLPGKRVAESPTL